jgi:hypothetical protein
MDNISPRDKSAVQRLKLQLLREQDRAFGKTTSNEDAIEATVKNYETAFRMQLAVPEVADIRGEPKHIREMYGIETEHEFKRYYALQCLRARRLIERGVRFIEITCPLAHRNNSPWDQHSNLVKHHNENALITDQPVAALIRDLRQRGLLEETIVIWAGEMGRTPHTPEITPTVGRDHHVNGYSIFMAGGGFQGGMTFGETDEFGNAAAENPLTIHDIHATILHQMGLDHDRLTFRFGGREVSLTDVHGRIVRELISA